MAVVPTHGHLDDVMQGHQGRRQRHIDPPPDLRRDVLQFDSDAGNRFIMTGYHADGFAQRDGGYLLGGLPVVFACLASLVVSTVCLRPSPLSIANCDRRAA